MKKLLLLAFISVLLVSFAYAELPELAQDYVLAQGFAFADISEYSGKPKCFMQEDNGWQSVSFATSDTSYCVMALEELDANYNPETLRRLFFELVQKFDWDVVFYWPDYDTADKIAVSYGITSDLDKTKLNFSDKDRFINQLETHLFEYQPINDQIKVTDAAIETYKDTIYQNFGFSRNSVTAFMEEHFSMPLTVSEFELNNTNICAYYILGNEFAACRTGNENKNMLLYSYSSDGSQKTYDDSELWSYFSQLKTYISENKSTIILDGFTNSADTLYVVIDILSTAGYERAVYDLVTDECTIRSMD